MIVAPTTEPSSLKCWSMPSLRPRSTGFLRAGAALVDCACSSFSSTFVASTSRSSSKKRPSEKKMSDETKVEEKEEQAQATDAAPALENPVRLGGKRGMLRHLTDA